MSKKILYPQSSARPIYLTVAMLGLLGLAGGIVMLIAMADVPKPAYYLLIIAFGLLIVALAGALAVLLATNTRRPWGIDPNLGPQSTGFSAAEADPYGATTEQLLRHAIQLPDGKGYGRRRLDDPEVVRRLSSRAEQEERSLPPPSPRPVWAAEMLADAHRERPSSEPEDQLREKPATASFTEVPLDQLDLLPATPEATDQEQEQANGDPGPHPRGAS
jgi:hypothetical protein